MKVQLREVNMVGVRSPAEGSVLWLISIAGLGFGFGLGHRFLYYADTMEKGSKSKSESVKTCSA